LPSSVATALTQGEKSNLPLDAQFSVLKNARRSSNEIAELVQASGIENVASLVTLKPRRIALCETVAKIETEVRRTEETELAPMVQGIYRKHVVPAIKDKVEKEMEQSADKEAGRRAQDALQRLKDQKLDVQNLDDIAVKKIHDTVSKRVESGKYKPGEFHNGETIDTVVQKLVHDQIYNKVIDAKVLEVIEKHIDVGIDDKTTSYPRHDTKGKEIGHAPLERLSTHDGEQRHTFMLAGAPASGKGTCVGMFEVEARRNGIGWDDVVKINTDVHRTLYLVRRN